MIHAGGFFNFQEWDSRTPDFSALSSLLVSIKNKDVNSQFTKKGEKEEIGGRRFVIVCTCHETGGLSCKHVTGAHAAAIMI